jgi:hypothetical protein
MYPSDDDWEELLLMDNNVCLKCSKSRRRSIHQLWESRIEGEYFKLCKILTEYRDKFREYYRMNIPTFDYILGAVKNDMQVYFNFHISHKFYLICFVHCTPIMCLLQQVSGQTVCSKQTYFVSSRQSGVAGRKQAGSDRVQCSRCDKQYSGPFLLRICWEITCQTDRVQCNRCRKQCIIPFMLPHLESVQTVEFFGSGSSVATALIVLYKV